MGLFNYTDAMVNCQNQFGPNNIGKLFEPKDSSTNDQVIEFAKNLILPSTEYLHIGFNDIATEGTWQYATGGDLVYTNWGGINPNNGASGNGEDCGETYSGTTWNDGICSHEQPSICEMISTGMYNIMPYICNFKPRPIYFFTPFFKSTSIFEA